VTPIEAREIVSAAKKISNIIQIIQTVGVFVNMPASKVNEIADFCALDWVQLSGDESWEYCCEIARPIIKAVRIGQQHPEEILAELATGTRMLSTNLHPSIPSSLRFIPLLDSQVKDKYGGTGMTFDWRLAQQIAERFPVIIAGGLAPDNVAQAIEIVAPWGVDVSSGVEVGGVKNVAKIRAFIEAVRWADAQLPNSRGYFEQFGAGISKI